MTKIYFKELQMSLRREHVEDILMMTANGACVKEIVVYPERDTFPGLDNMTFGHLLKDIGELGTFFRTTHLRVLVIRIKKEEFHDKDSELTSFIK